MPLFDAIYPKELFSSPRVRAHVLNEMKREGKRMSLILDQTTVYWNNPAQFVVSIRYKGGNPILYIRPDLSGSHALGGWHWIDLDRGTSVRWDKMSWDFRPKTEVPGSFGTNVRGVGGKVGTSRDPLPGILRRDWSGLLESQEIVNFVESIQRAIERGMAQNE